MDHQIAEFRHKCGTINVYDKGILINFGEEEVFLGEEFVSHFGLYCLFLDLSVEGIVTHFGGYVSCDEGNPPMDQFVLYHVAGDQFVISDDHDDGVCFRVNRSFLELLRSSSAYLIADGHIDREKRTDDWAINGAFPWANFRFSISDKIFEIYVPADGNTYILATTIEDRGVWARALAIAGGMKAKGLLSGSWQVVASKETGRVLRLEPAGGGVEFFLTDPEVPYSGASVWMDEVAIYATELLLDAVWPEGFDPSEVDAVPDDNDEYVDGEWDDDEGEGAAS